MAKTTSKKSAKVAKTPSTRRCAYSLIHSNGKVYIPLGDHRGVNASSYICEYDPATKTIRKVADVLSAVDDYQPGDFGYGKIHGRLNEGTDGNIYFGNILGTMEAQNHRKAKS